MLHRWGSVALDEVLALQGLLETGPQVGPLNLGVGLQPARGSGDQRVTALRERWVERITTALDDGNIVDAVRASIRPPEPAARLSAELAVRLADAAGRAMSAETPPMRMKLVVTRAPHSASTKSSINSRPSIR